MRWFPELPPAVKATQETTLEWLIRSFEKIGEWTLNHLQEPDPHPQYVQDGYGGISLSTPTTGFGSLSTSWTIIGGAAYDTELTPEPIAVNQDLANGQIQLLEPGIWLLAASLTADITPVTSNASNTVELAFYNVTLGSVSDQPMYFTIPRYGETIEFSAPLIFRYTQADVDNNNVFALAIRIRNSSPSVTVTDLISTEFNVARLAKE